MDSLHVLRYCSFVGWLVLVGCTGGYYVPEKAEVYAGGYYVPEKAEVYAGEYVISYRAPSHGPFNKVFPREPGDPVFTKGTLTSMVQIERGTKEGLFLLPSQRISTIKSSIVPYEKEKDSCRGVDYCSPNFVLRATTNDPYSSQLWGLKDDPGINVEVVENRETPDVKIMVLDTGVACEHEDLECDSRLSFNAITGSETLGAARDDSGHGSHVAGTIGATGNNQKGITGASTRTNIVPGKFLDETGSGSLFNAIKSIRWAIENDIDIINCSFGGGGYSQQFQDVINDATEKGILIIAAAGNENNDNDNRPTYPSSYSGVLSVASHTSDGERSGFSNYGTNKVAVSAPGSDIYSVRHSGGYTSLSGTSMAAPHVTGIAALLYERNRDIPKPERRQLAIDAITNTGRPNNYTKFGSVDSNAALNYSPSACKQKKCKECFRQCTDEFKCSCKKWRQCKKDCREESSCGFGCQ